MNQVAEKKRQMRMGTNNRDIFRNGIGDIFPPYQSFNSDLDLNTNLNINQNTILDYQQGVRNDELANETEKKKDGSFFTKMFSILNEGLNTAQNLDKTIDAFNNSGTEAANGVVVNPSLGGYEEKPDMTKYYVIGGVLVAAVVVGVVVTRKKKS